MAEVFGRMPQGKKIPEAEQVEMAKGIAKSLEDGLLAYLRQPKSDPEVLDNVRYVITQLSNAMIHSGDAASGKTRQDDLDAVLRGIGMVLDPARDRRVDNDSTAPLAANRFVEIVNQRFGYLQNK